MSIQVTLTFANVDDMLAHFAGKAVTHIKTTTEVAGVPVEKLKATKSKPEAEAPTTTATTQETPAPSSRTAEAGEDAAQEPSTTKQEPQAATEKVVAVNSAGDAEPVDYKTVAEAVTALSRKKGRDAAIAVLKAFGIEKLPDAKAEQYADILAACKASLEG